MSVINFYNTKQAYIVMKLDCMLQQMENTGYCDIEELHDFVTLFKTLGKKHQGRYFHLLDIASDLFDEVEQPCY